MTAEVLHVPGRVKIKVFGAKQVDAEGIKHGNAIRARFYEQEDGTCSLLRIVGETISFVTGEDAEDIAEKLGSAATHVDRAILSRQLGIDADEVEAEIAERAAAAATKTSAAKSKAKAAAAEARKKAAKAAKEEAKEQAAAAKAAAKFAAKTAKDETSETQPEAGADGAGAKE